MIVQLCLVVFIASSAICEASAIFETSAVENGLDGERGAATGDVEGGQKRKRQPSLILDDTAARQVVSVFNHQRGLVGASNMNYVDWIQYLYSAAAAWTQACNYDAEFNFPAQSYNLRLKSNYDHTLADTVQELLNKTDDTRLYYGLRSTYVNGICAAMSVCWSGFTNETQKPTYLYIVILTYDEGFNDTLPQYTLGPPCSRCQTGVDWCYDNVCRGDCSNFAIPGCCEIFSYKRLDCEATAVAKPLRSFSCPINLPVKFEIILLGLLSVLFAISW